MSLTVTSPPEGVWGGGSHMPLMAHIVYIQTQIPRQTLSLIHTYYTIRDVSSLLVCLNSVSEVSSIFSVFPSNKFHIFLLTSR